MFYNKWVPRGVRLENVFSGAAPPAPALVYVLAFLLWGAAVWASPLQVVTTTADLADLARRVGGTQVVVQSLSSGVQDPHHVEPRPSMVQHLRRADALVVVGMDLDGWSDSLIRASQNPKVQLGAEGYIDASAKIRPLDVPQGKIDGQSGDIHRYGNPHYWLDPHNGIVIAETLAARFAKLRPDHAAMFHHNAAQFATQIRKAMPVWQEILAPFLGKPLVAYHPTWRYFTTCFSLDIVGYIERKPGIPPSIAHIMALETQMKKDRISVIVIEPYSPKKDADRLAVRTDARVAVLAPSVGSVLAAGDYMALMTYNVNALRQAFQAASQ